MATRENRRPAYRRDYETRITTEDWEGAPLFAVFFFPFLTNPRCTDVYGRFDASPRILRSTAFPRHTEEVKLEEIVIALDWYEAKGIIRRYTVRGHVYGRFVNFDYWQPDTVRYRGKASGKHPDDPAEIAPVAPPSNHRASTESSPCQHGDVMPGEQDTGEQDTGECVARGREDSPTPTPLVPSDPLYAAMERLTAGRFRRKDPELIKQARGCGIPDATILAAFADPLAVEKGSVAYALSIAEDWHSKGGPPKRSGKHGSQAAATPTPPCRRVHIPGERVV